MNTIRSRTFVCNVLIVLTVSAALACAGPGDTQETAATVDVEDTAVAAHTPSAEVSCEMTFTMKGWSAIVSKAEGEGVVTCDNGQTAEVELRVTGGGLTVGKTKIDEGKGVFSDVADISEIFGDYAQAEASAGAVEAVSVQALTKGEVSLAITTEGRGWSLGVSGAKFSIEKRSETTAAVGANA